MCKGKEEKDAVEVVTTLTPIAYPVVATGGSQNYRSLNQINGDKYGKDAN